MSFAGVPVAKRGHRSWSNKCCGANKSKSKSLLLGPKFGPKSFTFANFWANYDDFPGHPKTHEVYGLEPKRPDHHLSGEL